MRQHMHGTLENYIFPNLLALAHYDDDGEIATKSVSDVYNKYVSITFTTPYQKFFVDA